MAYDLLIKNGTVIDGTGAPRYQADVAVKDGKIAEIGRIGDGAAKIIDAAGASSRPALSTRTPITTRRSAGTRRSARPRGTASPRS